MVGEGALVGAESIEGGGQPRRHVEAHHLVHRTEPAEAQQNAARRPIHLDSEELAGGVLAHQDLSLVDRVGFAGTQLEFMPAAYLVLEAPGGVPRLRWRRASTDLASAREDLGVLMLVKCHEGFHSPRSRGPRTFGRVRLPSGTGR